VTESEFNELCELIKEPGNEAALKNMLEQGMSKADFIEMDKKQLDFMLKRILKTSPISAQAPELRSEPLYLGSPLQRRIWRHWAVAASIILALGVGGYLLFFNKSGKQPEVVKTTVTHDVSAPTVARATLKLDDGRIVYLDSAKNGSLALQGNVNVVKLADGQIVYQGNSRGEVKYNTITNSRGSKVQPLTLIDGTKVWLNAESSITYPTAFVGNERKISITGEAYFEVTKDESKKFIVDANGVTTEVLGTHFNVNSYQDEGDTKVTLLEGSVRVQSGVGSREFVVIKPGEQVIAIGNRQLAINKSVDVEAVMAWKNGYFFFDGVDIQTIMRQVGRWYDVDVVYEGTVPLGHFKGKPSRNLTASQMLKVVEYSGVKIKIQGKQIIVSQ
jgi:ferric-dicitrate binding protein FerR (iron transport regulator)